MISTDKRSLQRMGLNGQRYAEKEFSKITLINKLNQKISELVIKNFSK